MKKVKKISVIMLIAVIVLSMLSSCLAYTVELDPEKLLSLPWMITNGKGNITVKDSVTSYQLYYQSVEILDTTFAELEKTMEEQKKFNETEKTKLETLNQNVKTLVEQYNKMEDKQSEEAKEIYTKYEQAREEYNVAYEKYKTTFDSYTQKIKDLTPSFVEEKWIETKDKTFDLNLSEFSGKKNFVVWVKLEEGNNTHYDAQIYTVNGSKTEETEQPEQPDNSIVGNTAGNTVGNTTGNTTNIVGNNHIAQNPIPAAGMTVSFAILIAVIAIAGIYAYVRYIKYGKDIE